MEESVDVEIENSDISTTSSEEPFDYSKEATDLRKALDGIETDEKAIIEIITKRNNDQRLYITSAYQTIYSTNLMEDLKSNCKGKFLDIILALLTESSTFITKELEEAVDMETIVEIICTLKNDKDAAVIAHDEGVLDAVLGDKGLDSQLKDLLIFSNMEYEEETLDSSSFSAIEYANALYESEEGQSGTFEKKLIEFLTSYKYLQLQRIFKEYEKLSAHSIEDIIIKEFSGSMQIGLLGIVRFIKSEPAYLAQRIHDSHIKNSNLKDSTTIRIIVSRSEIDLLKIKESFEKVYEESLEDFIKKNTSGDYMNTLLAIISNCAKYKNC